MSKQTGEWNARQMKDKKKGREGREEASKEGRNEGTKEGRNDGPTTT